MTDSCFKGQQSPPARIPRCLIRRTPGAGNSGYLVMCARMAPAASPAPYCLTLSPIHLTLSLIHPTPPDGRMEPDPTVLASLRKAVEAMPDDVPLRVHLATLLLRAGQRDEAIRQVGAVLQRDPGNAEALALLQEPPGPPAAATEAGGTGPAASQEAGSNAPAASQEAGSPPATPGRPPPAPGRPPAAPPGNPDHSLRSGRDAAWLTMTSPVAVTTGLEGPRLTDGTGTGRPLATVGGHEMHALLIGIDRYTGFMPPLNGCVNDIDAMQRILIDRLRVAPDRIRRLASPRDGAAHEIDVPSRPATRDNILAALRNLGGEQVAREDRVFIYYSGHGTGLTVESQGVKAAREALVAVNATRDDRGVPSVQTQSCEKQTPQFHNLKHIDCVDRQENRGRPMCSNSTGATALAATVPCSRSRT